MVRIPKAKNPNKLSKAIARGCKNLRPAILSVLIGLYSHFPNLRIQFEFHGGCSPPIDMAAGIG
jgi:hypothetical protein